jgi:Recombinase/Recombinase zinc beta ribbon domain
VFSYFDQLQSARQVMLRLQEEDRKLPRRATSDRQVRWTTATYRAIHDILTNPVFAGAYAYGRKRTERRVTDGVVSEHQRRAPREEWHVCIPEHHPSYITFERYLANQQRLRANWRPPRGEGGGAAREGRALLQGLIRCGRCGRRMQVGYSGKTLVPNYSCAPGNQLYGTKRCQSVGGRRIERVVLDAVFEALQPAGIEATLRAIEHAGSDHEACAPSSSSSSAHRSTPSAPAASSTRASPRTGSLPERSSGNRSSAWPRSPAPSALGRRSRPNAPTRSPSRRSPSAGAPGPTCARCSTRRAPATVSASSCCARSSADVVVTVDRTSEQHAAELRVVWEGGAVTEHTVALPRTGSHTRCTDQDTIALVRRLAERYPDKQIAAILARQGRRTGAGNQFTAHSVHGLRTYHKIPAAPVRTNDHDGEMVTIAKAASELDVFTATVHRWLREGFIVGEQITPGAPWQIRLTDELRQRVCAHAPDGWLPLAQAAQALGVARQTVLHKVQRGELAAVYVHRGKRKGPRIQVKREQAGLFENHVREETQC